jgi:hypothetical protein
MAAAGNPQCRDSAKHSSKSAPSLESEHAPWRQNMAFIGREGDSEMHIIDFKGLATAENSTSPAPSGSSNQVRNQVYGGNSLVASLVRKSSSLRRITATVLPGRRAEKERRDVARARWRMVRNKYVSSIARYESMQVFQEVVRLAFQSLAPQRF